MRLSLLIPRARADGRPGTSSTVFHSGRRLARAGISSSLVFLGGCALIPQFGTPPIAGPPAPFLLTAEQAPIMRANDPVPVPAVTDFHGIAQIEYPVVYELPRARIRRARPAAPVVPKEVEVAPAVTDSVVTPEEPITIVTRGGADSRATVDEELREAARMLSLAESGALTEPERETVMNLYDLIAQAEHALERGDVSSAAGLARKARLLATELTAP